MSVSGASHEDEHDRRLGEAIDGYMERWARGEPVAMEEWVARFPDLADELRECLAALPLLQHFSVPGPVAASRPPGVPGYEVLEEIGRGGMGVVRRAVQIVTKRTVALKFLASGQLASPAARLRFAREVELAAALDHPGIVRVLEAGDTAGGVYCAMELVDGQPLHVYLARIRLSIEDKLRLFISILEAVQYAHQRGVIHRDLKPSNIMIDRDGRPRILDFGLARLARRGEADGEATSATREGQLVGTLPYFSPEQAAGAAREVETRSDLYALGVVLYEMLAGRLPYETVGALDEALHRVRHTIPPRPSEFRAGISADLDRVVLKALEKSKAARYQTAAEFAEDIRCYLRGEPPEANRNTRFYLLRKAYARHRRQVLGAAAAIAMVLLVSAAILWLYVQVREERDRLNEQLHVTQVQRGLAHLAAGHDTLAEGLLRRAYRDRPNDPRAWWSLMSFHIRNPLVARIGKVGWVTALAHSHDGRLVACGNLEKGRVAVFDAATSQRLWAVDAHVGGVRAVQFIPSQDLLVSGGADGVIKLWRTRNGQPVRVLGRHVGGVMQLRFAGAHQRLLSSGRDGRVVLWDLADRTPPQVIYSTRHAAPIVAADLSTDGRHIAVATGESTVLLLKGESGEVQGSLTDLPGPAEAVRFSGDGRRLAVWSSAQISVWETEKAARLWRANAGLAEPRPTSLWENAPSPHQSWTPPLEFSCDGDLLAVGGWDAAVRLWDPDTGELRGVLRAHGTAVYALTFQPVTRRLVTGCVGSVYVWDLDHHAATLSHTLTGGCDRPSIAVSSRGEYMAWSDMNDGTSVIGLMGIKPPHAVVSWPVPGAPLVAVRFDQSGRRLFTAAQDGLITVWDIIGRHAMQTWKTDAHPLHCVAVSTDGARMAVGGRSGQVQVWTCAGAQRAHVWSAHRGVVLAAAFSPDGRYLLTGGHDRQARLWEIGRSEPLVTWPHDEWVNAVAFTRDGRQMATGGADLRIRLGRVGGPPVPPFPTSHAHWITGLAFLEADPDRVLVSGGYDGAIRFQDTRTGEELAALPGEWGPVQALAVSEDERYLAVAGSKLVQLIDLGHAAELIRGSASAP